MKSYSQCGQDLYAFEKTNNKKDGYYIEIGAYHATDISNTKMLEELGWRGISFETRQDLLQDWGAIRSNDLIICNATNFDFKKCFHDNNIPKVIDYLSLDIDEGTLDCLKILPLKDYNFRVITLEHDEYSQGPTKKNMMRKILYSYGYKLDKPDVDNQGNVYEDWWLF